jgi:DNA-binding MarR family transcriptional regulator
MTVVVDNPEGQGLVERVRNARDRRTIHVHLTHKGRAMCQSIFPQHARYVADLASVLTEDEQIRLGALLKKLGTSLAAESASRSA